jgi:hypothetical protein
MKTKNLSHRFFLSLAIAAGWLLSFAALAQDTREDYKKRKERPLNISGANLYTPDESENEAKYRLREGVKGDFMKFYNQIKAVKTPYHAHQKSNTAQMRAVAAAEYDTYFNIADRRDQSIMERPVGNRRLFVVGSLPLQHKDIYALLLYGIDGNMYQYTKLITFDKEGNPIDVQNVQYHIYGKTGGFEQLDVMYCHINKDFSFDCYTTSTSKDHNQLDSNQKPKETKDEQGFIYEIQADGTISRVGELDLSDEGRKIRRDEMNKQ